MGVRSTTAIFAAVLALQAHAQDMPAPAAASGVAVETVPTAITAPAGTAVQIEFVEAVNSEDHEKGDTFPIALHAPLVVDGFVVLPAGTRGVGEIVHVEASSNRGVAGGLSDGQDGELILAARYLEFDGKRIPLRSLKNTLQDINTNSPAMEWIAGASVLNTDVGVARGALAEAKLAADYTGQPDIAASLALQAAVAAMPSAPPPLPVAAPGPCCTLDAGTLVEIEINEDVGSRQNKKGDKFALTLRVPLSIDGVLVIPAGTPGVGEVVHAERSRTGGKAGELILAARYLEFNGQRVPLRGMKLGQAGVDRSQKVATLTAALSAVPVASLLPVFMTGGEVVIDKGTRAQAKLSAAFVTGLGNPTPTQADTAPVPAPIAPTDLDAAAPTPTTSS